MLGVLRKPGAMLEHVPFEKGNMQVDGTAHPANVREKARFRRETRHAAWFGT